MEVLLRIVLPEERLTEPDDDVGTLLLTVLDTWLPERGVDVMFTPADCHDERVADVFCPEAELRVTVLGLTVR